MFGHAKIFGMEEQDFFGSQTAVEVIHLRHHADTPLHRTRINCDIDAFNLSHTTGWPNPSRQNSNCGRLTGAVWTQQSEKLAAGHCKRNPLEGFYLEALATLRFEGFL